MSNYTKNRITDGQNHAWVKILKFIPKNGKVLDIGCSSGGLGEYLRLQKGCTVDGVEPDKKDAKLASKKLHQVWNSDIEAAVNDIRDKYDVIVFADVLEHLMYPDQVLRSIKKLLKPAGKVVFSVPNMSHVSIRLALLGGSWKYTETGLLDKTHLHYWDTDTVRDVFEAADMNLLELDAVTYKYPDRLIQKRLNDIGFKASKKGLDLLAGREASTFQIVGVADAGKLKHDKITLAQPALQEDISYMAQYLTDHINNLEVYVKHLEAQVKDLDGQVKDISNSRYYKLGKRILSFMPKHTKR